MHIKGEFRTLTLTGLLAATVVCGGAFTEIDDSQGIEIDSDSYNQVVTFNYTTQAVAVSNVAAGEREVEMRFYVDDFSGAFCYDYAIGAFTEGFFGLRYRI